MEIPKFSMLEDMRKECCQCRWRSFAQGMHPNPRYYKYLWWVFCKYCTAEGEEFLSDTHSLTTAKAMRLMQRLESEQEPYILYNTRLPREGTIFDPAAKKWQDRAWAPAFDEDTDEIWNGHK